ncbi:(2Fe-2S)-binding protein [bacterium]|nr:(2Fe-2S)-binding protein [bacterium]
MIKLTIDGQEAITRDGEDKTLLQLAQSLGIKIPTLCYHPSLEPSGGCRLCMVEITKPSWEGWSKLVVSCAYPAEDGIIVKTNSESVIEARKFIIKLLLFDCPDSEKIRSLADEYGIEKNEFTDSGADSGDSLKNCILCGLCVRVCRDLIGESVLSFVYRGVTRRVMTPYNESSDVCLTCGACAFVCPTGAIELNDIIPYRYIEPWHTQRELKKCASCGKYFVPLILADKLRRKLDLFLETTDSCPECRRKSLAESFVVETKEV